MMTNDDYKHFVCIVDGKNPDELMAQYDSKKKVDTYVKYRFKDAKKLKEQEIELRKEILLKDNMLSIEERDNIRDNIRVLNFLSDEQYFKTLLKRGNYTQDSKTNDILSTDNPDGRWFHYQLGKNFSIPFLLKDGRETFQAKKGEIDWNKMHLSGKETYEAIWDMVIEGKKPQNEHEQSLYNNMKNFTGYLDKFETKENYALFNTAFWGYAFLSEKTGWIELESNISQVVWVKNYYNLFIKRLPDDDILTIFECTK